MNDLMTKSFLSYVELKKQAQKDLESEYDIEAGQFDKTEEQNLSEVFEQSESIKSEIVDINTLLVDLHNLNEQTKSTISTKVLRGLRDRMDSDSVSVLRKAKIVKSNLEILDQSNVANRKISDAFKEGSPVDRARISITHGLRIKLREMVNDFQSLREKILEDHKNDLRRRYYTANGEEPGEELMVSEGGIVQLFEGKTEMDLTCKERHEAVMDIQRSLNKLHQVFLDMAVLVEAQGEKIDNDIEENMASARRFVNGGTDSLYYANQMKKKNKKWVYFIWAVGLIILLVCLISLLAS